MLKLAKLIVVTCIDTRVDIEELLDIEPGSAHIIRNAGGIVTDDTIRTIILSMLKAHSFRVLIVGHTKCGIHNLNEEKLRDDLIKKFGTDTIVPVRFFSYENVEENVKHQMERVISHSWIPKSTIVRGFVHDITNHSAKEVKV